MAANLVQEVGLVFIVDCKTAPVNEALVLVEERMGQRDETFILSREARADGLAADWVRAAVVS